MVGSSFAQAAALDLRETSPYKECASVKEIHFEGVCSSSYAITVAGVASDVVCASNNANTTFSSARISYQNIMECCSKCFQGYENGCFGGSYVEALDFLTKTGAVTGSKKGTANFCRSYQLPECYQNPDLVDSTFKACGTDPLDFDQYKAVGSCNKVCDSNSINYDPKKSFVSTKVSATGGTYAQSMATTMGGNPNKILITEMAIFEDIYTHNKADVYVHLYGKFIGTTTVAILGYGTDANTTQDFWIVRFPWGSKFGDNGFLKIQRGTNNCGIENVDKAYYLQWNGAIF